MRPFSTAWWRQERRSTEQRWYLWPVTLVLAIYGLGSFAWLIYNGWWASAAFTAAWMTALVVRFAQRLGAPQAGAQQSPRCR
jgi:hypothetical protein